MNTIGNKYYVQQHKNKKGIHYDLRIPYKNESGKWVFFSLASRKLPELWKKKKKRVLFIRTPDHAIDYVKHPYDYVDKEENKVSLWDKGTFKVIPDKYDYTDVLNQIKRGHLKILFKSKIFGELRITFISVRKTNIEMKEPGWIGMLTRNQENKIE